MRRLSLECLAQGHTARSWRDQVPDSSAVLFFSIMKTNYTISLELALRSDSCTMQSEQVDEVVEAVHLGLENASP